MTVPRLTMNLVLLWLGSRWLASTLAYADVLLNAIALEFILLLKDLLYVVIISNRNKVEVRHLKILPPSKYERVHSWKYIETYKWLAGSMIYTALYLRFQRFLPGYKYDIHDVCVEYIANKTAV